MRLFCPRCALSLVFSFALALAACEGCEVTALQKVLQPGAIAGRVCDPSEAEEPIYGARVWVVVDLSNGTERKVETVTDADGRFLLEEVPPGIYTLYVRRGSFRTELEGVVVEEEQVTKIEDESCLSPEVVTMTVYEGHDSVEDVLTRLGYTGFSVVETHHRANERDESTPSWIVEAFSDYERMAENDILFINCGAHEWALERAEESELAVAFENLRRFVAEGGSVYLSDWSYDLLEALYPDAVDWLGDDALENDAERGLSQFFVGTVLDESIAAALGVERAALHYEQSRIAIPIALGEGARALISADIDVDGESGPTTLEGVPVLLEYRPVVLGGDPNEVGRILFTTFHNGAANTEDMDEVLRAMVFSL